MISASSRADVNAQMNKSAFDDTPHRRPTSLFFQTDPIPFKTLLITLCYNPQISNSRVLFQFHIFWVLVNSSKTHGFIIRINYETEFTI